MKIKKKVTYFIDAHCSERYAHNLKKKKSFGENEFEKIDFGKKVIL